MATVTLKPFDYKAALAACMSNDYVSTMLAPRSRMEGGVFFSGAATLDSKKATLAFFNSCIPAFKADFGVDVPQMNPARIYSESVLSVSNKYSGFPEGVYSVACLAIYFAALHELMEKAGRYPGLDIGAVRAIFNMYSMEPKVTDLTAPITDEEFVEEFGTEVRALVNLERFELDGVAMLWLYFNEKAINDPAVAAGAGVFKGVVVYRTAHGLVTGLLGQSLLQRKTIAAAPVGSGVCHRVFGGTTLRIWSHNHRLVISDLCKPDTGNNKLPQRDTTREEFICGFIPKQELLKMLNYAGACLEVVIHDANAPVVKGKVRRSEDALVVLDYHSVYTGVFPDEVTEAHRILRECAGANKNLLVTQSSWCKEWFSKETSCTAAEGTDAGIFVAREGVELVLYTTAECETRAAALKGVHSKTVAGYLDHFSKAEKSFTTAKEKLQGLLDERSCEEIIQLSAKREQALAALSRADVFPAEVMAWLTKVYKPRGKDTLEARKAFLRNAPLSVLMKFV